jgi:hypothetical protein
VPLVETVEPAKAIVGVQPFRRPAGHHPLDRVMVVVQSTPNHIREELVVAHDHLWHLPPRPSPPQGRVVTCARLNFPALESLQVVQTAPSRLTAQLPQCTVSCSTRRRFGSAAATPPVEPGAQQPRPVKL